MKLRSSFIRIGRSLSNRYLIIFAILLAPFICIFQNCDTISNDNSDDVLDLTPTPEEEDGMFLTSLSYKVPHDINIKDTTNQRALAEFAWKEFIALNWPSSYNTRTHTRGEPDTTQSVEGFLKPDPDHPLVWQTYKHRVEVFPENTSNYNTAFNSAPQYFYSSDIKKYNDPSAPPLRELTTYFNNLDETSEIGLCTLFYDGDPNAPGADQNPNPSVTNGGPGAPRRVIYQAKASKVMFDYIVQDTLYDQNVRDRRMGESQASIDNGNAGLSTCPDDGLICFPHGTPGGSEGSIEIKASWRQLTLEEYNSGRFLTAPIINYIYAPDPSNPGDSTFFYNIVPATPTATSLPYGLLGLHIIHKTVNVPTYVFATFEQVDNLDIDKAGNQSFYYNNPRGGVFENEPRKQFVVNRPHAILSSTDSVNMEVHKEIVAKDSTSVWQYYKIIGAQGKASNNQYESDFFLANIVTETNEILRSFSGTLNNQYQTIDPRAPNIHVGLTPIIAGGCKGCHGNAQVADFSFITKNAPFDGKPDAINASLYIPLD